MATRKTHNEDCNKILGKSFDYVHSFLDQYAEIFTIRPYLGYHRTFLHNIYGLSIVKIKWGSQALYAAKIHLIRDVEEMILSDAFHNAVNYSKLDHYCKKALLLLNDFRYDEPMLPRGVINEMNRLGIGLVALAAIN